MVVGAKLLPPARLLYGHNSIVNPGLAGEWIIRDQAFFDPATATSGSASHRSGAHGSDGVLYGIIGVGFRRQMEYEAEGFIDRFRVELEREASKHGMMLSLGGHIIWSAIDPVELDRHLGRIKQAGGVFALVVTCEEAYAEVKIASAARLIATQVVKYDRVSKTPKGIYLNVLLKINAKIGGTNHVLASRSSDSSGHAARASHPDTAIPSAISWLLDNAEEPTMLMGVDFSETSFMGTVASFDMHAAKYGAFLCTLARENDNSPELRLATEELLKAYKLRNHRFPTNIVVFRDGVSDSEFDTIVHEVTAIKQGAATLGIDRIRVAVIMCQKRHRFRFFYEESTSQGSVYHNPCPGICVDGGAVSSESIVGDRFLEFYINSHSPIQGTCKPCRYVVLYDDIGLKLAELELMTYWLTYMYVRCNRSVSYPAPAYYAHWASRRAKVLSNAGARADDFIKISRDWLHNDSVPSMFFV
jgi:hypothetical protein